jgi:hypothetical protein
MREILIRRPPPYAPPGYVYYPVYGQQLPGPNCYWFRMPAHRDAVERAKQRGHSTAAAEAAQQALEQSLRVFENRRQQVFERLEAKQR